MQRYEYTNTYTQSTINATITPTITNTHQHACRQYTNKNTHLILAIAQNLNHLSANILFHTESNHANKPAIATHHQQVKSEATLVGHNQQHTSACNERKQLPTGASAKPEPEPDRAIANDNHGGIAPLTYTNPQPKPYRSKEVQIMAIANPSRSQPDITSNPIKPTIAYTIQNEQCMCTLYVVHCS